MILSRVTSAQLIIGLSAISVIAACAMRYRALPSFWLDEAFVAASLRDPTPQTIFAPLPYEQYFPRVYLAAIAALRLLLGYQIWVLRLLPALGFIVATVLWGRLLAKRSGSFVPLAILSAAFLVGGSFWLDQAIQLKQYTLDVLVALIPFSIGDEFFKESLVDGKRKWRLMLLAVPCFVSYSYPFALGARVLGWYAHQGRRGAWRLRALGICALVLPVAIGLVSMWITDYQFNLQNRRAYVRYWHDSILSSRLEDGISSAFALIANFIWGWHHGGLMPVVIAAVAPLQALGVYRVTRRWKNSEADPGDSWSSRTLGSLVLLLGVLLASAVFNYPISAGRLTLFTQVHTQILAIEGALFILTVWKRQKAALIFLCAAITIVAAYSVHRYIEFIRTEPKENIRPMLSLIKPELASTVYVHPCSAAQVESLPEPLPVERVVFATRKQLPQAGGRAWILWTNMSDDHCHEWLREARSRALSWQIIHEGPGRGLTLAEF